MKRIITLCLLVCGTIACDDALESNIPSLPVNASFNTYTTHPQLASPGGYATVTKPTNDAPYIGFGGIIVLHGYTDQNVFAFDLACPVENKQTSRLQLKDGVKLRCPECGSEFDGIFYGNTLPSSGMAKQRKQQIRRYNTSYTDNVIYVRN